MLHKTTKYTAGNIIVADIVISEFNCKMVTKIILDNSECPRAFNFIKKLLLMDRSTVSLPGNKIKT